MGWLTRLGTRLRALRHGEEVHREMDEEWQFHIGLRTEENVRRGMTPEEARRSAEQNFGNVGYLKDVSWDVRGGGLLETFWQDLRFAVRQLLKSPGFAIVALLSLGLGIGANAAIFSLVSAFLLRPLPITHPEQVYAIIQGRQKDPSYSQSLSYLNYKDIRDRNSVLDATAVFRFAPMSVSHNGSNERLWGYLVSANYFDVLGVRPFLGRTFVADEERGFNAHPVAVLSYGCWQRRLAGDPGIIGRTIKINDHDFQAIGVAPPGFSGTESVFTPEFWVPSTMQEWIEASNGLEQRGNGQWLAFGRLKSGVTLEQAGAQLNAVAQQLAKENPREDDGMSLSLMPPGLIDPDIRNAVIAFTGALMLTVLLVLLLASTNLASLLLARAVQRRKEIAVRMAIGATRIRLARQLLTESVLLSVVGAAFGLAIGYALMQLALASLPRLDFALTLDLRMDWRVVSFVLCIGVLTGIGFGLVPALHVSREDVVTTLKDEVAGGRRAWLRSALVMAQVALSFVLLITAGLTVRSLLYQQRLGPGFDPNHAVTLSVDLGLQGYDQKRGQAFYRQLVERVRALPGVTAAGTIRSLPLGLEASTTDVYPEGKPKPVMGEMPSAMYENVSPGYFSAMGIPLVAGRDFAESDTDKSPDVVIVNETLAQKFWPGENAVGKHLFSGNTSETAPAHIVGVAKNGKYQSLGETPQLLIYYPVSQVYASNAALVVRTNVDPGSAITSIRSEVQKLDPALPVFEAKTMHEHMRLALFPLHAGAVAVGSFALLAMILAAIGIYGVVAYLVTQRTQEIGIRMALGARAIDVCNMVLRQGIIIVAIGMVFGMIGAIGLSKVIATLLYGVSTTDPQTFLLASVLLVAVALAACLLPARRATEVDPVTAIRSL